MLIDLEWIPAIVSITSAIVRVWRSKVDARRVVFSETKERPAFLKCITENCKEARHFLKYGAPRSALAGAVLS